MNDNKIYDAVSKIVAAQNLEEQKKTAVYDFGSALRSKGIKQTSEDYKTQMDAFVSKLWQKANPNTMKEEEILDEEVDHLAAAKSWAKKARSAADRDEQELYSQHMIKAHQHGAKHYASIGDQAKVDAANAAIKKHKQGIGLDEAHAPVTMIRKGDGGHHRVQVGTIKVGPHAGKPYADAKFDTSHDPNKPSGHGSSQSLSNYTSKRQNEGSTEANKRLTDALKTAHATGDPKKVLAAMKSHGYSHHDWELHESTLDNILEYETHTDKHGVTYDDEGNSTADRFKRVGPPKHSSASEQRHYHDVPYAKKDAAKAEGMKFDGASRKWYHKDAASSKSSAFKPMKHMNEDNLENVEEVSESRLTDRMNANAKSNKDAVGIAIGESEHHQFSATISDPDHPVEAYRGETRKMLINVKSSSKGAAKARGIAHLTKKGLKVHGMEHVKKLDEEVSELDESHKSVDSAKNRLKGLNEKHPTTHHVIVRGLNSGKYFVVRKHDGVSHIAEDVEYLDEEGNVIHEEKSAKEASEKTSDKKKGIRVTPAIAPPLTAQQGSGIFEGDESDADYQKYMKEFREKQKKAKKRSGVLKSIVHPGSKK